MIAVFVSCSYTHWNHAHTQKLLRGIFYHSAWLNLGFSLVLADSWMVCLPSWDGRLLSSGSELMERTVQNHHHDYKKDKSEFSAVSFMAWCWVAKYGQSRIWMKDGKLVLVVMQPESEVGSELLLTSFYVTHPSLAAVKVDRFWQPTSHPDIRVTETEREGETALEPLIKMHSVIQILIFLHNTSIANTWVLPIVSEGFILLKTYFF